MPRRDYDDDFDDYDDSVSGAVKEFLKSFKPHVNVRQNAVDFCRTTIKVAPSLVGSAYATFHESIREQVNEVHENSDFYYRFNDTLATTDVAIMLTIFSTFYFAQNKVGPYLLNRLTCNCLFRSKDSPYYSPEYERLVDDISGESALDASHSQ